MKKIAIVAANGKAAKKIIAEAVNRGFDVTGFGRKENNTLAQHYVQKDLFELTAEDLNGFDAVVDAFGAWTEETLPQHSPSLKHLCDILSGTDTRLLIVGGAGSLYVNKEHTATVMEGADFPDAFKPLASAMGKALGELRERKNVKWTYISPAGDFQADGERSGNLAGTILSAIICAAIHMKLVISPLVMLSAAGVSMGIGMFFGIYPARKAAHLSPMECLRHE